MNVGRYPYMFIKTAESEELKINLTKISLNTHGYYGFVFCMHYFGSQGLDTAFQFDYKDDCVILITDTEEFIKRMTEVAAKTSYKFYHGKIQYKNLDGYESDKNPFQKPLEYKEEVEYRFYFQTQNKEETEFIKLYLGDISDISVLQPIVLGKSLFKLSLTPAESKSNNTESQIVS